MTLTLERAQELLDEWFAPWVKELNLQVERIEPGAVTVRMPFADRLARGFGTVSGQAIMAAADTAMVLATVSTLDDEIEVTTVSQSISFLRPIADADTIIEIAIVKSGRTLAFANAVVYADGSGDAPAATASSTYAILRR